MSAAEFACVLDKLRGHTDYIYLHILGEPLSHPELEKLLTLAADKGFNCCITTNGTLLSDCAEVLLSADRLYKLSVSLHSFEANFPADSLLDYLDSVWNICSRLAENGTLCALRLWNDGGANCLNDAIISYIKARLGAEELSPCKGGYKLCDRLYLETAAKFEWPDENAAEQNVQFCRGLRDQIGILCDGTVVPCCLDAEGSIALGSIFTQSLDEILASPRAKALYEGFSNRAPTEELCRRCGYATRFNKSH